MRWLDERAPTGQSGRVLRRWVPIVIASLVGGVLGWVVRGATDSTPRLTEPLSIATPHVVTSRVVFVVTTSGATATKQVFARIGSDPESFGLIDGPDVTRGSDSSVTVIPALAMSSTAAEQTREFLANIPGVSDVAIEKAP